jgi:hypothetical protein
MTVFPSEQPSRRIAPRQRLPCSTATTHLSRGSDGNVDDLAGLVGLTSGSASGESSGRSNVVVGGDSADGAVRAGLGSRSAGLGSRRASTRAATDGEVDAGLVGLVDAVGVPEPLDDAVTGAGAVAANIGDGDGELLLVLGDGVGVGTVLVPALQDAAEDGVAGGGNDRDVGDTGVRGADVDLDLDFLADGVLLDVLGVVVVLEALAEPDVASGGVVVGLAVGDLELALDVAVVVAHLVVVHLLTASLGESVTGHAGSRAEDEAVGAGESDEGGRSHDLGDSVLHGEGGVCFVRFVGVFARRSTCARESESKCKKRVWLLTER